MKTSEVISALTEAVARHGDLEFELDDRRTRGWEANRVGSAVVKRRDSGVPDDGRPALRMEVHDA